MSLFPVRYKQDSVNGGTYNYRQKSAVLWRDQLENEAMVDRTAGSRYDNDFIATADAPATGTLTGSVAVRATTTAASGEAAVKVVPAGTARPLHGWMRMSATTSADAEGLQVTVPNIGDIRLTTGKRSVYESSVNIRKTSSFFVGLGETGAAFGVVPETLANKDYIGFYRSNGGTLKFITHKTDVTAQSVDVLTAAQLDALSSTGSSLSTGSNAEIDLPINLGFAIRFNGANSLLDISVNGVAYPVAAQTILTANGTTACLPTLSLTRGFVVGRGTSQDEATVAMECDWLETHQQD